MKNDDVVNLKNFLNIEYKATSPKLWYFDKARKQTGRIIVPAEIIENNWIVDRWRIFKVIRGRAAVV